MTLGQWFIVYCICGMLLLLFALRNGVAPGGGWLIVVTAAVGFVLFWPVFLMQALFMALEKTNGRK